MLGLVEATGKEFERAWEAMLSARYSQGYSRSRIWNLGMCLLESCWGLLGSKLGVLEVQVGGLGGLLGSMLDLVGHK